MKSLFLLSFFFIPFKISAQFSTKDVDSLKKTIANNRNGDTLKVITIISLGAALMYSDNQQALEYTGQGLKLSEKLKWERGIKSAYRQYGAIYMAMSDFYKALEYNHKAIKANKSNNEKFNAEMELNQGGIYLGLENFTKALTSYYAATPFFRKEKLNYQTAVCLLNTGMIYFRQRILPDSSIYYFKESLSIAEENNFQVIATYAQSNLGGVYNMTERFNEAKGLFEKLIENEHAKENTSIYGQSLCGQCRKVFNAVT
jgi:tetratricopeptide (TPR) repeat protein